MTKDPKDTNEYIVAIQEILVEMIDRGFMEEELEAVIDTAYEEVWEEYFFDEDDLDYFEDGHWDSQLGGV